MDCNEGLLSTCNRAPTVPGLQDLLGATLSHPRTDAWIDPVILVLRPVPYLEQIIAVKLGQKLE